MFDATCMRRLILPAQAPGAWWPHPLLISAIAG